MTREELIEKAKTLAGLEAAGSRHGMGLVPIQVLDAGIAIAKAFLELVEPKWLDAPDANGLYWIDYSEYVTLTTVVDEWVWTHGLKQPWADLKSAKWAKAYLPVGPYKEGI